MKHITANMRPPDEELIEYRKTATVFFEWITEPFTVQTTEGTTYQIDPAVTSWEDGYFLAWPSDGSDPYPVAASFVRENYEPTGGVQPPNGTQDPSHDRRPNRL